MEWQPIETAPKDGSWILVNNIWDKLGPGMVIVSWTQWRNGEHFGWAFLGEECGCGAYNAQPEPSHWMPLPPTPEATQ